MATPLADLNDVRQALAARDEERRLAPLGLTRLLIGRGTTDVVADQVALELSRARGAAGRESRVVLLVDEVGIRRGEADVKDLVEARCLARFQVRRVVLRDGHAALHASEEVLQSAADAARDADCIVSVGGGTITDIAKVAAFRAGGRPLVVVQTAASVDGYTDDVSVVLRDGVKRTIPSRWPDVVLADIDTISGAPAAMTAAGYGEALSTFTAPADWYLATAIGVDGSFHPGLAEMLAGSTEGIDEWAEGIPRQAPGAIERLTRLLAFRGICTGVSGTSACLSGVEHLISHMLDLYNQARGLPIGLHGAQVGVASVLAAATWEYLRSRLDADGADADIHFPDPEQLKPLVGKAFRDLDGSGAIAEECWRDYQDKIQRWNASRVQVQSFVREWDRHRPRLARLASGPRVLGAALTAAGVARRFDDLNPSVSPELARWALTNCHLMRSRLTAVDVLSLCGWWTEADVTAVLAATERALAGGAVAARAEAGHP